MGSDNHKPGNSSVTTVLRAAALLLCLAVAFVLLEELVPGEGRSTFNHAATAPPPPVSVAADGESASPAPKQTDGEAAG